MFGVKGGHGPRTDTMDPSTYRHRHIEHIEGSIEDTRLAEWGVDPVKTPSRPNQTSLWGIEGRTGGKIVPSLIFCNPKDCKQAH